MLQFDLSAQERNAFGKGASKKLRRDGKTPVVMYGSKSEPLTLNIDTKELTRTLLKLQRRNAVFNIDIDNEGATSRRHFMVQEVQTHPIDDSVLHADFCEVSMDKPVILDVPVRYTGIAKGVELGGDLAINLPLVKVRGLVLDIPDFFEVDVTSLKIGKSLTCEAISVAGNVELLNDISTVCVSVHAGKRETLADEDEDEGSAAEASEGSPEEGAAE